MALTAREEEILRKMVEVEQARAVWNASSLAYQNAIRIATDETKATLSADAVAMEAQYADLQAKEAELKALATA